MSETGIAAFPSVRAVGAVLPSEALLPAAELKLPGQAPADYELPLGLTLSAASAQAWENCRRTHAAWTDALAALPAGSPAVAVTLNGWLKPLLDALGFRRLTEVKRGLEPPVGLGEEKAARYPVSHHVTWPDGAEEAQVGIAVHLVGGGVDLDVRTVGQAARAPQGMVQELLNRHPRYLWGVLSNGHRLRLLRDSSALARQAYVEFDLDDMFTHQRFADFRLLYLTLHASRFAPAAPVARPEQGDDEDTAEEVALSPETCLIERWRTTAITDGARALTALRQNVARALGHLGTGFVAYPGNDALRDTLATSPHGLDDLHRALLRVAYRLLVLFVVEDRGLLHPPDTSAAARSTYAEYFSSARLRRFAATRPGSRHADLWDAHLHVTDALAGEGLPALGLPGLAAWLFDREALGVLGGARIANRDLLAAVGALSRIPDPVSGVTRPVDYRNLDSEELGGVYEGLLAYVPRYDPARHEFGLAEAAGNDRKKSGSYYTPSALIALVLDEALDPLIDEARRAADPEQALLDLTVVDPACGSGHFLVAAARRIGVVLAQARTGEPEPGPVAVREATADVIGRCIHGVDLNELAVEITKVALWLEAFDGTRPLPFLDAHIKVGNALLGTTPSLLADGLPDAAFTVLPGDDRKQTALLKKRNKAERSRRDQGRFERATDAEGSQRLAARAREFEEPADTAAEVRRRATAWRRFDQGDPDLLTQRFLADAWCAAFVQPKNDKTPTSPGSGAGITDETLRRLAVDALDIDPGVERTVYDAAEQFRFFHWHLEFPTIFAVPSPDEPGGDADPTIGWRGGFSCVVGNPPWERVKIQDKEFFAGVGREDIANAGTAAIRKRMIEALASEDTAVHDAYVAALRASDGTTHLLRDAGRFPLTGTGDVNTYSVFAETFRDLMGPAGGAGLLAPTALATDMTTSVFFRSLVERRQLRALHDFVTNPRIWTDVGNRRFRFAAFAFRGSWRPVARTRMSFVSKFPTEVTDDRLLRLDAEDFLALNPNTGNAPVFLDPEDARITAAIYRRFPILVRDGGANPWGLSFGRMFDMANDSGLFVDPADVEADHFDGWELVMNGSRYVPLYEAKLLWHFDHRLSSYALRRPGSQDTELPRLTDEMHDDPTTEAVARHWIAEKHAQAYLEGRWDRGWLLGWRDIARSSDMRTFVPSALPASAVSHVFPLAFLGDPALGLLLHATWSSLVLDYVVRQKISGTHMTYSIVEQLPCPAPVAFDAPAPWQPERTLAQWVAPHVLELSYTSWRLKPYAEEMHDDGPPFRWDSERRALLRADLDAAFMHIYGLTQSETEHVLDSFGVVKKYELRDHREFRTRRLVLEAYDRMAAATSRGGVGWEPLADIPAGEGPRHPEESRHR